jgi:hypothetical protein
VNISWQQPGKGRGQAWLNLPHPQDCYINSNGCCCLAWRRGLGAFHSQSRWWSLAYMPRALTYYKPSKGHINSEELEASIIKVREIKKLTYFFIAYFNYEKPKISFLN